MPVAPDDRWTAPLEAVGARLGEHATAAFHELVAHYDDPERHYHTFEHASSVVDTVLTLCRSGDDWPTTVLAAWFHDAVHDPRAGRGANEGASMVLAVEVLARLGAARASGAEVARLIAQTVEHRPDPADTSAAVLCDADLSVLGGPPPAYDRYAGAVRREYGHLDDETWREGRAGVLRGLLDRPTIFTTDPGIRRWEAPARANLERELAALASVTAGG